MIAKKIEDMTPDELKARHESNSKILPQMVGTLYPSIITDENERIRRLYYEKTGKFL